MFSLSEALASVSVSVLGSGSGPMETVLGLVFGAIVGFSLGLTGGGGSIFAVPLLVYGLGVPPSEATGVSLAAVGGTALAGFVHRWKGGEVEVGTGLMFSVAGMISAPVGTWIGDWVPDSVLLLMFSGLMLLVAARMWRSATKRPEESKAVRALRAPEVDEPGPVCERDPEGKLRWSSRCAGLLVVAGLAAGLLSGLFGVGGGFVIVPALVFVSGMGIHRAVATSLMVISLVAASGVASHLVTGKALPLGVTGVFVLGGVAGLGLGTALARRISGPKLQKIFAVAIVAVAVFIVFRNLG